MAWPSTSAGPVGRYSQTVASDPRTMSRSSVIRRSKSSANSGERSRNHIRRVAGGIIHEAWSGDAGGMGSGQQVAGDEAEHGGGRHAAADLGERVRDDRDRDHRED